MENEFWINVELLSLGGNIPLQIIRRRRNLFEIILDDQELGRIYRDKNETWQDMDSTLPANTTSIIGLAIADYILKDFKMAG